MTTVRWAFIGAGRHPRNWLGPAVAQAANAEPVGVWNRGRSQAEVFAAELSMPRVFDTLDDLLADGGIDAVYVATPNNLHAEHAIAALRAGKHVLVEKPMAAHVTEAQEMVRAAREADRTLGVGFHLRHHPLAIEARRRITEGAIGEIHYAGAHFNLTSSAPPRASIPHGAWKQVPEQMGGAGVLMGMGVHLVDLLRYLTGDEIVAVSAIAGGVSAEQPLETFGQALLEFERGMQAHITYGGGFPLSRNDVELFGAKGRIIGEQMIDVHTTGALHLTWPEGVTGTRTESLRLELTDHYQRQVEAFSRAIMAQEPFGADGVDGLRSVEVTAAIIESHRTGKRVEVKRCAGPG